MLIKNGLFNSSIIKISDNTYEDQNGFLVCANAILGRSGIYRYPGRQLGLDTDEMINVLRKEEDVFNPESMKTLEQRPITIKHPRDKVTIENVKELSKGEVFNVRRDGNNLVGDLIIKDKETKEKILCKKLKELSLGYEYNIEYDEETKLYSFKDFVYNHLAFVDKGRAKNAMILDGVEEENYIEEKEEISETTKEEVKDNEELTEEIKEEIKEEKSEEKNEEPNEILEDSEKITSEENVEKETEIENKEIEVEEKVSLDNEEKNIESESEIKMVKDINYFLNRQKDIANIEDADLKSKMSSILQKEMDEFLSENNVAKDSEDDDIVVETNNEPTKTYEEQMQDYYNKFDPSYYDNPNEALSFYKKECNYKNAKK